MSENEAEVNPKILQLNRELEKELQLWHEECNTTPGNVITFDVFLMDAMLNATVHHLVEKGIIDEDEFTIAYKTRVLENMRKHRPNVKQARLQELQRRLVPGAGRMDIPRGKMNGPS